MKTKKRKSAETLCFTVAKKKAFECKIIIWPFAIKPERKSAILSDTGGSRRRQQWEKNMCIFYVVVVAEDDAEDDDDDDDDDEDRRIRGKDEELPVRRVIRQFKPGVKF